MEGMSTGEIAVIVLVTGLVVVFLALAVLIAVIKIYGTIVHSAQERSRQKKLEKAALQIAAAEKGTPSDSSAPEPVPGPQVEAGIPDEVVAAISAAVFCTMGESVSVVSVRHSKRAGSRSAWGQAGVWTNTKPF